VTLGYLDINNSHAVLFGGAGSVRLGDFQADGSVHFNAGATEYTTDAAAVSSGYHVWRFARQGSTLRVYRDGVQVGSDIASTAVSLTLTNLLAFANGSGTFPADFAEALVYLTYHADGGPVCVQNESYLRDRYLGDSYNSGPYFVTVYVGSGTQQYNAFTSLLRATVSSGQLAPGDLLATWYSADSHVGLAANVTIRSAKSSDGGKTWPTSSLAWQSGNADRSDLGRSSRPTARSAPFSSGRRRQHGP
jgi:hypothetical protein